MGVFKWLRRERSNGSSRRHSGGGSSSDSASGAGDPLRTEEYERALAQFLARRSANPTFSVSHRATFSRSQEDLSRQSRPYVEQTAEVCFSRDWPRSERKVGRKKSSRLEHVPQIQFLFSNQIFMPGSKIPARDEVSAEGGADAAGATDAADADAPPSFFELKQSSLPFEVTMSREPAAAASAARDASESPEPPRPRGRVSESQRDLLSRGGSASSATDDFDSGVSAAGGLADRQLSDIIHELKSLDDWADEQLRINKADPDDSSCVTVHRKFEEMCQRTNGHFRGVPIVRSTLIFSQQLKAEATDVWCAGSWGSGQVYLHRVKRSPSQIDCRLATELDILTTLRQPNMLLLMGLCHDREHSVTMIFEDCLGSLYDILHKQGKAITPELSVRYVKDVTNALLFLNMHGKVHSCISSHCIMLTPADVAKLANFSHCSQISKPDNNETYRNFPRFHHRNYQYQKDTFEMPIDYLPLITQSDSITSLDENGCQQIRGDPKIMGHAESEEQLRPSDRGICFRWQAPELFRNGNHFTEKCDVFSISLVLWECCNLTIPWINLNPRKLSDLYLKYGTGIDLPESDKCHECILQILEGGLHLESSKRTTLKAFMSKLQDAVIKLQNLEICPYDSKLDNLSSDVHIILSSDEQTYPQLEDNIKCTATEETERPQSATSNKELTLELNTPESTKSSEGQAHYGKLERLPVLMKTIQRYEVTDLDNSGDAVFPYLTYSPSSHSATPKSEELLLATPLSPLDRTDSTEYCSLLSPDIRQKTFQVTSCSRPHLDSPREIDPRMSRLNQSLTPKSYTPLHIRLPSIGALEGIKQLTNSDIIRRCESERKYKFEIRNSSMPDTPIARNTKLRRNAWLSGEVEDTIDRQNNGGGKRRHSDIPYAVRPECEDKLNLAKSPRLDSESTTDGVESRKSQPPMKTRTLFRQFSQENEDPEKDDGEGALPATREFCLGPTTNRSLSSKSLFKSPFKVETNLDRFRSRSQSWTGRPSNLVNSSPKTEDESLSLVNIKPLVAIHERWIEEARQTGASSLSLPDTHRLSPTPVKPASHRLDPLVPTTSSKKSLFISKGINKSQNDIDIVEKRSELSSELKEVLSRRKDQILKGPEFYEASLWKREKDICVESMPALEMENCSTPIRTMPRPERHSLPALIGASSMNTATYEELYERIKCEVLKSFNPENRESESIQKNTPDGIVRQISSSLILDIQDSLKRAQSVMSDKNYHTAIDDSVDDDANKNHMEVDGGAADESCVCRTPAAKANFLSKTAVMDEPICNCNRDDDAISLPEQFSSDRNDDFSQKTLKRCQGFNALQEARSTEDLYIDDELLAHPDNMQTLGDNMKLIPLHGSLHEALCDKFEDCCLIKIQEETDCNHVYIVCDKGSKETAEKTPNKTFSVIAEEKDDELTADAKETNKNSLPVIMEECESIFDSKDIQDKSVATSYTILDILVETSECLNNTNTLNDSETQALLIVEDYEDLDTSNPNEGYAEFYHSDEVETQKLIDLDMSE